VTPKPLDAIFREALGDAAESREIPAAADLDARLAAGRAAWPDIAVDEARFVRALATHADPELPPHAQMPDVYLACACAAGNPTALAAFDRLCAGDIASAASRVDPSASFRDEVAQLLRHQLFLAFGDRPPKIAEYAGRAPLRSWVRVVAKRIALMLRRSGGREEPSDSISTDAEMAAGVSPELDYMKRLYKVHFEVSIRHAFAALSPRARTLLRLYVSDRLTLKQLGVVYEVSHATIARWLAAARDDLVTEMRKALSERVALSSGEYESVVALVRSQLDMQLHELLRSQEASREA